MGESRERKPPFKIWRILHRLKIVERKKGMDYDVAEDINLQMRLNTAVRERTR